jgi:uncharacterized protein (TIGR03437 family)
MKTLLKFAAIAVVGTAVLYGQNVDTSGDGLLKGNYRFRQVAVLNEDTNGNPTEVATAFGVISFAGNGTYTVLAGSTYQDNTISNGAPQPFPTTFTSQSVPYAIGGNGLGYVVSPIAAIVLGSEDLIYGSVAQGIFAGGDTESGAVADIFIAIPVSTSPTNATFTTSYSVGLLDFTGASNAALKNALFNLNPNGKGGFGTITLNGQANNLSATTVTQTVTGATYNFGGTSGDPSNATLNIPLASGVTAPNALFVNGKSMYVSSDGNFVLGWTPGGYDIFFGVSALTTPATNSTYAGTYFTSALEDIPAYSSDNYYGSNLAFVSPNSGSEIVHQRLNYPQYGGYDDAIDYVTDDATTLNSNGATSTPDYNGYLYAFGDGGKAFVAIGTDGFFSLVVGTQAPSFSGSGVFLNPIGIFNTASYAPITASIAPGEMLTLFGTGMAPPNTSVNAPPGPISTMLGEVQVLFNGQPAPVFYVSPGQIATIAPYELSSSTTGVVTIQINNNGQLSNQVSMYLTDALPGVFTQTELGIGLASVLHNLDYSLVTPSKPAQAGEYIDIYLTGLGTVTPTVGDGGLGPANPLSYADQFNACGTQPCTLAVTFDDYNASLSSPFFPGTVTFAGLAPGFAGLYQISVQVPSGLVPGDDVYLEISTDAADVNQVYIPIGGATAALAQPHAAARHGSPLESRKKLRGAARHGRGPTTRPRPPAPGSGLSQPSN